MKYFILLCTLITLNCSFGQSNYKITYTKSSNGTLIEKQDPIIVFGTLNKTYISTEMTLNKKVEFPIEQTIIHGENYIQFAQLNKDKTIFTMDSLALSKQHFDLIDEIKKILGYNCKKAKTVVNSNTIELWYTNDLKIKASPTFLGQKLGLVLEMVRNGNYSITATKVEKIKEFPSLSFDETKESALDVMTYKDLVWKSRFTTIPVFKNETINYVKEPVANDSVLRFANGSVIVRKIKLPTIPPGGKVFLDVKEQSNGDAYDRTGSVFIIPTDKPNSFMNGLENGINVLPIYYNGNGKQYQGIAATETYTPLLELMRFFTPFGIKKYNTIKLKDRLWEDQAYYRQDITEVVQNLSNTEVMIGTSIGNYDAGGHIVSVNLTVHNEENAVAKPTTVIPLFNSCNVLEMAGQEYGTLFNTEVGLEVIFSLEKDLKNVRLRYISTGHGGWENGDEFLLKVNTILLDGEEIFHFTPWREDCGAYRLYNPASGVFTNGLSSSDYSRSNWCPGTATNPVYIDLGDLKAGSHRIQVKIPQGTPEGTSFSYWNVSGVLIGE